MCLHLFNAGQDGADFTRLSFKIFCDELLGLRTANKGLYFGFYVNFSVVIHLSVKLQTDVLLCVVQLKTIDF